MISTASGNLTQTRISKMGPTILSIATAALGIATLVYLQSAGAGTSFQTQVESCMKDPYTKANENYYKVDVKALDTFFWYAKASSML